MVRLYLKKRFTKERVSEEITDYALKIFGEFSILKKTKIVNFSTLMWKNDTFY